MTRASLLVAAVLLAQPGCANEERTPEGTVRQMLRAIESGETEEVYGLLAPQIQKKLEELASLATAQTGGRNHIKPVDLLIIGLNQLPSDRPLDVKPSQINGDRAKVELVGNKGKTRQTLELIRVEGRWRVLLPADGLRPLPPESRPTSRPS